VRGMLDTVPTLIFQNGQYDTAVMQRLGYMTQELRKSPKGMRKWFDTLIAHAQIDTESDHKLGYLAREYTDAPLWKKDVDHKGNSERKDADLWLYGAKDGHITYAVAEAEAIEIYNEGIEDQFSYKTDLFPIVREMTNLGLVIDETHRGRLLKEFTRLADEVEAEFKTLIKRDVSISSSAQIAEWLYDDCGYPSLVNSKGKPYKEGDGYSVASPAISAMLDSGILAQEHSDVLETLLKWRSAEVVRNRYLEKLPCRYDHYQTDEIAPAVDIFERRILEQRPAFSTIHPKWALTAKTGRWRCKGPTIHNWSARGWATYDMDPDRRDWTSDLIEEATGYPPMRINKKTGKPYPQVAATNLRRLGVPAAGHVFVGLDFDQVELRAFTVIAQNEILFDAFLKGKDPHALNYAFMEAPPYLRGAAKEAAIKAFYENMVRLKEHGSDEEKSQIKHLRTIAKRFVFLLLYGGEKDKLFRTMLNERDKSTSERVFHNPKKGRLLERERTARWYNEYHKAHPSIKRFHGRVDRMVDCDGRIVSPFFGRSRWFRYGLAESEKNEARNAMIQMAAQELTDQAILRICEEIPFYCWSEHTGLVIEVHDQIVMQVPENRADEACEIMKKCAYFEIDKMPFTAEVKISRSWASQG